MQDGTGTAATDRPGSAAPTEAWLAIAGHSPAGLAVTLGPEHRLEYANDAFARLTGLADSDISGRAISDVIRSPALIQRLDSVLSTHTGVAGVSIHADDGRTYRLSLWPRADAVAAGGLVVELSAAADMLYDPGAASDHAQHHIDDSSREALQQETEQLRELNARLVRSALREEALAEQERAASRAKSDFLAVVSHELRTPLTAVIGYTDMLQTGLGGLNEKGAVWTERIRFSAWHLREIVDDLIGTISENRLVDTILPEPTAAEIVAREALALIETAADEKGLTIGLEVPQHTIPLQTDRRKLRQVLTNMLSNAVKFTERGSIELNVEPDDDTVIFRVTDTGIGIADGDLDRIFEPFVQVDSSTTRRFGGCGLGLGLSRRYARALGGDLTVSSELGRGSTFVLTVPAATGNGPQSVSRSR